MRVKAGRNIRKFLNSSKLQVKTLFTIEIMCKMSIEKSSKAISMFNRYCNNGYESVVDILACQLTLSGIVAGRLLVPLSKVIYHSTGQLHPNKLFCK